MAVMASSTARPMVGWRAWACSFGQRASAGTQKMLWARYSSGSSGSAPSSRSASSLAWASSKASEMYLRKIRPRTTCLYSAASMLPRSASAMRHSLASKRSPSPLPLGWVVLLDRELGPWAWILPPCRLGAIVQDARLAVPPAGHGNGAGPAWGGSQGGPRVLSARPAHGSCPRRAHPIKRELIVP